MPYFRNLTGKPFDLSGISIGSVMIGFVGITRLVSVMAGSYPAFILSAFKPIAVLRGNLKSGGGALMRKILVVGQFIISIALVILAVLCTLFIRLRSMRGLIIS